MSSDDTKVTKKTRGRLVPSRFLQSAENYSSHSSGGTSSTNMKLAFTTFSKTRTKSSNQTIIKKTSTPAQKISVMPAFDTSAIPSTSSCVSASRGDQRMHKLSANMTFQNSVLKNSLPLSLPCGKKSKDISNKTRNLDTEIDLYYAQYQLALLMEHKVKMSLQSRSNMAMEKIYEVLYYLKALLAKHGDIKQKLNIILYILKVHEHLQNQEKILLPILEMLPTLEKYYKEIAVAVDCVKHKLPVKDVILTEEGLEAKVIELLEQMSTLLDQVLLTAGDMDQIVSSAETGKIFVNKGKTIIEEIKRGSELLSEARETLLSETSLKISSIQ